MKDRKKGQNRNKNQSLTHVDDARQAELGADRRRRHAVLPGPRLSDDALLRHAQAQQHLAQRVVDLVRAGVVEVLALEPDLGAAAVVLGEALGEVEGGGAADVVLEDGLELGLREGVRGRFGEKKRRV